jgi:hypothetical protein
MSGAPVFYDGKLIGIQTIIPKYTSFDSDRRE